jgi:hypothetical protein
MSNEIGIDLTSNSATALFTLGTLFSVPTSEGVKKYKYIQYEAGAAAVAGVAGEVAYLPTTAVGGATGTIVTSDLSDSIEVGAGVLQAALADGYYGWIQVQGIATLTIALTAGADGDPMTPTGAADGTLDVSEAVTDSICAHAVDATAYIIMCDFPH